MKNHLLGEKKQASWVHPGCIQLQKAFGRLGLRRSVFSPLPPHRRSQDPGMARPRAGAGPWPACVLPCSRAPLSAREVVWARVSQPEQELSNSAWLGLACW